MGFRVFWAIGLCCGIVRRQEAGVGVIRKDWAIIYTTK